MKALWRLTFALLALYGLLAFAASLVGKGR